MEINLPAFAAVVFLLLTAQVVETQQFSYVFSYFYGGPTCPGAPLSASALALNFCLRGGGGVSNIMLECIPNGIRATLFTGENCSGNISVIQDYNINECEMFVQNEIFAPNVTQQVPLHWIPLQCGINRTDLIPLDEQPLLFPSTETDLPTISTSVWINDQCDQDPGAIIWHRNSQCGIALDSVAGVIFSIYECVGEGQVSVQQFSQNNCQNNPISVTIPSICSTDIIQSPTEFQQFSAQIICQGGNPPADDSTRQAALALGITIPVICCCAVAALLIVGLLAYKGQSRKHRRFSQELQMARQLNINLLDDITIKQQIATGEFGKIYKAVWKDTLVALKGVKSSELTDFVLEMKIISELRHPHVLTFYGIYLDSYQNTYMVVEFMNAGDLLNYLQKEAEISTSQLTEFCIQATIGVEHLHSNQIIHRDLACRNLLLHKDESNKITLKVADFGLSRIIQNYYETTSNKLPVRWLAPEVIQYNKCNISSDVWALGVVMWEIFSRGTIPYAGLTNDRVLQEVPKGLRMSPPLECPPHIRSVMVDCWKSDPAERPTAADISKKLRDPEAQQGYMANVPVTWRFEDRHSQHPEEWYSIFNNNEKDAKKRTNITQKSQPDQGLYSNIEKAYDQLEPSPLQEETIIEELAQKVQDMKSLLKEKDQIIDSLSQENERQKQEISQLHQQLSALHN